MRRSRNSGWADEAEMDAPEGSASQPSLGTGEPPSSLTAPIMTSFTEPELHDTTIIDSSSSSPEMIPATGPNQHRPARSQRSRSSRYPPLPEDQRPEESRMEYLRRCLQEALDYAKRAQQKHSKCADALMPIIVVLFSGLVGLQAVMPSCLRSKSEWMWHRINEASSKVLLSHSTASCRHTHNPKHDHSRAEPGPKSWRRGYTRLWLSGLLLLSSPTLSHCVPVKPRVSPVAATGEQAPPKDLQANIATGAKHSGEGQILLHHEQNIRKTALKNAIKHAKGTSVALYRGRPLRTEASARQPDTATESASAVPQMQPPRCRRRNNRRLNVLTYNCAGLTSALYTELLVWLKLRCPDIVFLQETH